MLVNFLVLTHRPADRNVFSICLYDSIELIYNTVWQKLGYCVKYKNGAQCGIQVRHFLTNLKYIDHNVFPVTLRLCLFFRLNHSYFYNLFLIRVFIYCVLEQYLPGYVFTNIFWMLHHISGRGLHDEQSFSGTIYHSRNRRSPPSLCLIIVLPLCIEPLEH